MKNVGALCGLIGCALAGAAITGAYKAWVAQPPVVVFLSGVGLVVVGLLAHTHCECAERRWSPWILGFLTVVLVLLSPAALQPRQVESANRVMAASQGLPPLAAGSTPELGIPEVVGRLMAPADDQLRGQKAQLKGQVGRDGSRLLLSRVVIICCAADARTYEVELMDPRQTLAEIPEGAWVHVVVTLLPGSGTEEREWIPEVIVQSAEPIADPGYGKL